MANTTLTLKAEPQPIPGAENITAAMTDDGKLILIIDPTLELGVSESGKSINIATTHGNKAIGTATLGINMYKPNPNRPRGGGARTGFNF